ncbi:hypothetical protein [Plantactinospora sp. WMMB782]|uniref:hypothetical protein n=1 Tax=Plantactinospora sp. WMMB782 TaxID=3404121 RepID=UPI003B929B95
MRKVNWLRRLGVVSAVVAVGLSTAPTAARADGYDTPRSATADGAGNTYAAGVSSAQQRARAAVLAAGTDCTPGDYYNQLIYMSPGGGTWVFRSTHQAMCVD